MERIENDAVNNPPHCLICSSSVTTPDIKVEPYLDQNEDDQSLIIFLLASLLEVPKNEAVQQQEELINQQLNISYCESCTKLIFSAKQVYTQIFGLTQKFRKVQKQIVEHISSSLDLHLGGTGGTSLSTSNHDGLLDFLRNFLNNHNFNGFGFPFVVDTIPNKICFPFSPLSSPKSSKCEEEDPPREDKVKDEPISENEDGHIYGDDYKVNDNFDTEDYYQSEEDKLQNSSPSSGDEDTHDESDSDSEPPPPPKKAAKKVPIKKSPSSPQKKANRKSPLSSTAIIPKPPRRKKPIRAKKESKFDRLYPNYPKRIRNPTTKKYHCLEASCSKMYPRKTALESHIIIQHLQDNFYKCSEPSCGKSYTRPEQFQDHVSWHAGIPRWKCEEKVTSPDGQTVQCTEQFFVRRKLNRHVQKMHQKDKPFICETCGRKFECQDYLTSNKFNHHSEKGKDKASKFPTQPTPQICNYCGKSYSTKQTLEVHINLVHDKTIGKFKCQFCEDTFSISTQLKIHMFRKHKFSMDGFTPKKTFGRVRYNFKCDVKNCKINFVREENWRKHMEEKHGKGKEEAYEFSCKYCGKGFHLKFKMEYHEEAHENKESKPFSCEICGNRFARLPYLKIHKKNIHKIAMERARTK